MFLRSSPISSWHPLSVSLFVRWMMKWRNRRLEPLEPRAKPKITTGEEVGEKRNRDVAISISSRVCFEERKQKDKYFTYSTFRFWRVSEGNNVQQMFKGGMYIWRLQNFRDFDPFPPPCLHFGPIHSTKFTQPSLLHLLLGYPSSPSHCRHQIEIG